MSKFGRKTFFTLTLALSLVSGVVNTPARADSKSRARDLLPALIEDADRIPSRIDRLKAYNVLIQLYLERYPTGLDTVITRALVTAQDIINSSDPKNIPGNEVTETGTVFGPIGELISRTQQADQVLKREGNLSRAVHAALLQALQRRAGQYPELEIESIIDIAPPTPSFPLETSAEAPPPSPDEVAPESRSSPETSPGSPISQDDNARIQAWFIRRKQIETLSGSEKKAQLLKLLEDVLETIPSLPEFQEPLLAWVTHEAESLDAEEFVITQLNVARRYWRLAKEIEDSANPRQSQLCGEALSASHYAAGRSRTEPSAGTRARIYYHVAYRMFGGDDPMATTPPAPTVVAHSEGYAHLSAYESERDPDPKAKADTFAFLVSYWTENSNRTKKKTSLKAMVESIKAGLKATTECRRAGRTDCSSLNYDLGYLQALGLLAKQDFDQALSLIAAVDEPFERLEIKKNWIEGLLAKESQ